MEGKITEKKSFGIGHSEFMQGYTQGETGLNKWISRGKNVEFVGQNLALNEFSEGKKTLQKTLVTLKVRDAEVEANGYEPIWSKNNERIGMTALGGYGHNVDKSLEMAFVKPDFSEPGIVLKAHIVGKEKHCVVLSNSPWDPKGLRMRS